ncbi:MAG: recombinase family protein [Ktedonobacterales bacterium]
MYHQWRVRRQTTSSPDGQQRWDRAYQLLLQWTECPGLPPAGEALLPATCPTGKAMQAGPGMQRALAIIRSGEADLLVVKRLTRVARDMVDGQVFLREVTEAGGALRSTVEGTFTGKLDDMLLMAIHAFQAEKDWSTIREQSRQGLQSRVDRGRPLVSVPLFGYLYLDGERGEKYRTKAVMVTDPESAPIVKDIFAKAVDGWSMYSIANHLNDQGTITPSALAEKRGQRGNRTLREHWTPDMVRNILWNESYTGRHTAYRNKAVLVKKSGAKPVYRMQKRAPEDMVSISIPALIDDATWTVVQKNIHARHVLIADEPLLNQGIAICGVCGSKMIAARQTNPQKYRIYKCRRSVTHECPGGHFVIKAETMDQDIWEKVKEIIRDEPRFQRLVQGKSAKLEEQHQDARHRAEMVQKELSDWQEKQATAYALMVDEKDETTRGLHRAELLKINETVAALKKRLEAAQNTLSSAKQERDTHQELLKSVAAITRALESVKADSVELAKYQAKYEQKYAGQRFGSALEHVLSVLAEEVDLDGMSREEKRRIMQGIDVQVQMYPRNYVDADGKAHERGELSFNPHVL